MLPDADLTSIRVTDAAGSVLPNPCSKVKSVYARKLAAHVPDFVTVEFSDDFARPEFRSHVNRLPLPVRFTDDEHYKEWVTFYIDMHRVHQSAQIKLLQPSSTSKYQWLQLDGAASAPGVSGSPILRGRVATGHSPSWQFDLVGVVYGRIGNTAIVCAIPVDTEFRQILQSIHADCMAQRYTMMEQACNTIGDESAAAQHAASSAASAVTASAARWNYSMGVNELFPETACRLITTQPNGR